MAGVAPGLSLASSRMDGSIDGDAALGYLEWTMTFKNANSIQQEARTQVLLPPGAVVSRATLWVDGEEREAAFAARGRARKAYQEIVIVQNRDPLLVTTSGPDRVLVQCFPVPPNGGKMKIRLGITVPMVLAEGSAAMLPLPRMVESNFATSNELRHAVWFESHSPLARTAAGMSSLAGAGGVYTVRGDLKDADLCRPITVKRDADASESWAPDPLHPGLIIRQRVVPSKAQNSKLVVVVLDGSTGMREYAELPRLLGRKLAYLPGVRARALLAGDQVIELTPLMELGEAFDMRFVEGKEYQPHPLQGRHGQHGGVGTGMGPGGGGAE